MALSPEQINPWDRLSGYFDPSSVDPEAGAIDNVLIAWPTLFRYIREHSPRTQGLRVLDYGCGAGGFSNEVFKMGNEVVGVDTSEEMIKVANRNYGSYINFFYGSSEILPSLGFFDLVTSIMAPPFIPNIQEVINNIANVLNNRGLFLLADFNREFVLDGLNIRKGFTYIETPENPIQIAADFGDDLKVPVYTRTTEDYKRITSGLGLSLVCEEKPPFTEEFLRLYKDRLPYPTRVPEYLILGFRKNLT